MYNINYSVVNTQATGELVIINSIPKAARIEIITAYIRTEITS